MEAKELQLDLEALVRPNILKLKPYRCARDDYKDDGTNILLDANENAYGPGLDLKDHAGPGLAKSNGHQHDEAVADINLAGLHRYPDPHLIELKERFCTLRTAQCPATIAAPALTPANVFLGVGSDEAIDALLRCFCTPGRDKILTCPPTYGMYSVSAAVNDVAVVPVPLTTPTFSLDLPAIDRALAADPTIKLIYLTSPGNPTAKCLDFEQIKPLLVHPTWRGLVVLDEAYIDFAPSGSSTALLPPYFPRLVVMQTLSKAFGLAGMRLGVCFADTRIANLLNALKAPYSISSPTAALAFRALQPSSLQTTQKNIDNLLTQRERLRAALAKILGMGQEIGGQDANFVLVQVLDGPGPGGRPCNDVALAVYQRLGGERRIVVRFRGTEHGCLGALRITVGTEAEVDRLLAELPVVLDQIYAERGRQGSHTDKNLESQRAMEREESVVT